MHTTWIRILLFSGLLAGSVLAPAGSAYAQAGPQIRITQVDNSTFPSVTVYVSVTDSAGEPVGIDPAAIQIFENGTLMQPTAIRGGGEGQAEPLTTMLVMDISGSMDKNNKLQAAKDAARAYVDQMRAGDQAGLITYDTQVYFTQGLTGDRDALRSAIDGLRTGGDTAMYDALIEAEVALDGVTGRKAIIVLTDGLDNSSAGTADAVIEKIGPGGLTISTIGFGDASTASQSGLDETGLRSLAERSGGLYSYAADSQSLSALYQQYGRTLQSEYAITYVSPLTLRDGIDRNLNVELTSLGASTETRYNPGGVLPEVTGRSWTLFGGILAGLLVLLFLPALLGRTAGVLKGVKGYKPKGRIRLAQPQPAGKKPNIKIK